MCGWGWGAGGSNYRITQHIKYKCFGTVSLHFSSNSDASLLCTLSISLKAPKLYSCLTSCSTFMMQIHTANHLYSLHATTTTLLFFTATVGYIINPPPPIFREEKKWQKSASFQGWWNQPWQNEQKVVSLKGCICLWKSEQKTDGCLLAFTVAVGVVTNCGRVERPVPLWGESWPFYLPPSKSGPFSFPSKILSVFAQVCP